MGSGANGEEPKKKGGRGCCILVVVVAWLGLTFFLSGVFPVTKLIAGPVLCPAGTEALVAMDVWSSTTNTTSSGSSSVQSDSDLYCVDAQRRAYKQSYPKVIGVTAAATAVAIFGFVLWVVLEARRSTRRRKEASP